MNVAVLRLERSGFFIPFTNECHMCVSTETHTLLTMKVHCVPDLKKK